MPRPRNSSHSTAPSHSQSHNRRLGQPWHPDHHPTAMNGTAGISDPWTATGNIHEPIWMHPAWPKLFSAAAQRTHLGSNDVNSFPHKESSSIVEVIDKGSSSESHPAPLLFVHGAWHAAWCWDEHFLEFSRTRATARWRSASAATGEAQRKSACRGVRSPTSSPMSNQ